MALSPEELKEVAKTVQASILSDVDKRVDSKVSSTAPQIVRDMKEAQDLLSSKLVQYSEDLPESLKKAFRISANALVLQASVTDTPITKDNIDSLFKEIRDTSFDKGLIEREIATQNAKADKSISTEENKDEPKKDEGEVKKDGTPTLPGNSIETGDGSIIELDKTKVGDDGKQVDEDMDVLKKYPLSHDGVYLEARQKKFLASKKSGASTSSSELVKDIDLSKHKMTAQQ